MKIKIAFIVLFLFISAFIYPQQQPSIIVNAKVEYEGDSKYFLIEGRTDLPHNTIIAVKLSFNGDYIPEFHKRLIVRNNKFFIKRTITSKIPSGIYNLIVAFSPSKYSPNISPFNKKFDMYIGNKKK